MKNILTAEEFLQTRYQNDLTSFYDNVEALQEFTRLHVEAILMNCDAIINKNSKVIQTKDEMLTYYFINKDCIRNAYPLENIK